MKNGRVTGTLALTAAVFVVGLFIGFRLLTAKAETAIAAPTCTDKTISNGAKLTSNRVTVNVYNASKRAGLANRVLINLQRVGFLGGTIGNSASEAATSRVTILTSDRNDPRVKLVAAQFKDKVTYADPEPTTESGVTVLVGDNAHVKTKPGAPTSVVTDRDITVCVPVIELS